MKALSRTPKIRTTTCFGSFQLVLFLMAAVFCRPTSALHGVAQRISGHDGLDVSTEEKGRPSFSLKYSIESLRIVGFGVQTPIKITHEYSYGTTEACSSFRIPCGGMLIISYSLRRHAHHFRIPWRLYCTARAGLISTFSP